MFNFYKIQICAQIKTEKRRRRKQMHTIYISINGLLNFEVICKEVFKFDCDEYFVIQSLTFLNQYCLSQQDLDYFNNSLSSFLFESEVYDFIESSHQRDCHSSYGSEINFYLFSFEVIEMLNAFDQEELKVDKIFYGIYNIVNMALFLRTDFGLDSDFCQLKSLEIFAQYSMPKKINKEFDGLRHCTTVLYDEIVREIEMQDREIKIDLLLDIKYAIPINR